MAPPTARPQRITVAAGLLFVAAGLGLVRGGYLAFDTINPPVGPGYDSPGLVAGLVTYGVLAALSLGTAFAAWRCLRGARFAGPLVLLTGGASMMTLCACGIGDYVVGIPSVQGDYDYDMIGEAPFHTWVFRVDIVVLPMTAALLLIAVPILIANGRLWSDTSHRRAAPSADDQQR